MAIFPLRGNFIGALSSGSRRLHSCGIAGIFSTFNSLLFSQQMAEDNCVFCKIYHEKEPATVFYKDDEFVVFSDIRPAAKHHYLVVPKDHLPNVKVLTKEHICIVENLVKLGKRLLQEKQGNLDDARFGFHWPPFNSISHLHLHVISPASEMSFISKLIFREGSFWFVKPHYVLERLARL